MKKIKKAKKLLALVLALALSVALTSCGNAEKPANESTDAAANVAAKVAVVFASSGLGDKSFNDALYSGMEEAESEMGIEWVYSEPKDDAEYEGLISGYADGGDCDLIICLGGSQSSSLENVAPNYPDQKFVILDAVVPGDNIRSYTWRDEELGFLAGLLGASLSDTNKLGFIGAHDIPLCNLGAAGMIAGAHYVNPACEVLVDYANGWAEVNGCYEIATSMNEQGASLIYHTASAGGLGILNAGKEKGFLTVFFDGNLNSDAPDTNIASAIRDFPSCAKEAIQDVIDGNFTAESIVKGIAEDGVYLDFEGSAYDIPEDVMAVYNEAVDAIKSGDIVVPTTIDEANTWTA
nr:BMP family protein [uncultured Oscillibacter sp.]